MWIVNVLTELFWTLHSSWRCKQNLGGGDIRIVLIITVLQTAQHLFHQSTILMMSINHILAFVYHPQMWGFRGHGIIYGYLIHSVAS